MTILTQLPIPFSQQFEVVRAYTNLHVGEYYGTKGIDEWNAKSWEKEISEHDVSLCIC